MRILNNIVQGHSQLAFLDLEGTQFTHEMIAIGIVKVDIRKDGTIKKIHKGYHSYVYAKNKIGKIVTDLTGISEETIREKGKSLRVVMQEVKKYLGIKRFSNTLFITFGSHDNRILSQSLQYNLDLKEDDIRLMIKHNFDINDFISSYIRDEHNNTYSLENLLKIFGYEFEGEKHNPLYDALNLVYLYKAIIENPHILSVNYRKVLRYIKNVPLPVKKCLISLLDGEIVTPAQLDKYIEEVFE